LTIAGVPGKIEVQIGLSAFGVPQNTLDAFQQKSERLREILPA